MEVKKGLICLHFKGGCYIVEDVVTHSETQEKMVLYKSLDEEGKRYVRPYEMFISKVDKEKYPKIEQEYRFQPVLEVSVYREKQDVQTELEKQVADLEKQVHKLESQVIGLKNEQNLLKKDVKRIDNAQEMKKNNEKFLNL